MFENLWDNCTDTYKVDALHFLSASGLAWQVALKTT